MPILKAARRNATSIELIVVAALVFAGMLSERFLPLAAIAGGLFLLVKLAIQRRVKPFWPVDGPVMVLLVMTGVSIGWVTSSPDVSMPQALRLVNGAWLLYAVINWGAVLKRRLAWLAAGFAGAGLALAGGALLTVDWNTKFPFIPAGLLKALSPALNDTVHPNVLAGSLVLILAGFCGALVYFWHALRGWQKIGSGLFILFMAGILALTQSRGALIGLAVGLVVLIVLRFKRGWIVLPVCLALGMAMIATLGPDRIFDSLNQSQSSLSSLAGREEAWTRAVFMIEDFPITGVGIGTFTDVADTLYPFFSFTPGTVPHAHNLFLQIAVDLGIPGLVAWLMLWGFVIYAGWKVYRNGKINGIAWQMAAGTAILCAQVAMGVHGLMDAPTWGTRPAVLVWAIWGFAIAAWHRSRVVEKGEE